MKNALTRTLQALSDPTRREILKLLQDGDKSAGDLAAHFDMSAPSVSHHLNKLKNAELVLAERNGQQIMYSLNATVVQEFLQEMLHLFQIGENDDA